MEILVPGPQQVDIESIWRQLRRSESSTGTLACAVFANRCYASDVLTGYKTAQARVPVLLGDHSLRIRAALSPWINFRCALVRLT
jgi:hypothetical protein